MSPEWIQASARRVVAIDRAESSPVTHMTREDRSMPSSASTNPSDAADQRSRSSEVGKSLCLATMEATPSSIGSRRCEALCERRHHLGVPAVGAADRPSRRLCEMDHDICDVPTFAPGGRLPLLVFQAFQDAPQLRMLRGEILDHRVHASEPMSGTGSQT